MGNSNRDCPFFNINENDLVEFKQYLVERENSAATIEKYLRDIRKFIDFSGKNVEIDKEKLLKYKEEKELEKEEFKFLVCAARDQGKEQIAMIMETMCATGIRVSELKFFRVENLKSGMIRVWNKGKYRIVILPEVLRKKLLAYAGKHRIRSGMIFCTRTGREKNRSNIWREMKKISELAGVRLEKVFPHNLRHLFARTFYKMTKDLINLADILGHSSVEVTRIYTSDSINEWRRNLDRMEILEE